MVFRNGALTNVIGVSKRCADQCQWCLETVRWPISILFRNGALTNVNGVSKRCADQCQWCFETVRWPM